MGGGVDSYQGVGGRTGDGYILPHSFVFCSLMSCLFFQVSRT